MKRVSFLMITTLLINICQAAVTSDHDINSVKYLHNGKINENYPIRSHYFRCHTEDGNETAGIDFPGESQFSNYVQVECNGGVGDPMKDCKKVIYYDEQKILSVISTTYSEINTEFQSSEAFIKAVLLIIMDQLNFKKIN